jgi:hypothetical protein
MRMRKTKGAERDFMAPRWRRMCTMLSLQLRRFLCPGRFVPPPINKKPPGGHEVPEGSKSAKFDTLCPLQAPFSKDKGDVVRKVVTSRDSQDGSYIEIVEMSNHFVLFFDIRKEAKHCLHVERSYP